MIIIGVDFHPEFQQIALLNTTTGEVEEKRLAHPDEAEKFYRALASANETVRIGMEASGHARWFERLMAELQFELWIGDAAEIRTRRVRKQKTDRQDAQQSCSLLLKDRLSEDLGAELGEPGSAATVVASASHGAGTHARHESTASGGVERRPALQEKVVARARTAAVGIVRAGSVGEPAAARSAGVAGSFQPGDCGVDAGDRARSRELPCGAAAENASWSRCVNGAGVCADTRRREALPLRQAGGELSGTGAAGRLQRESPAAGSHHQARQFDLAFPAGGSGAGDGAQSAGVAQQIFSPGAAARTEDCESCDGPPVGRAAVLDDAQGMGLRAVEKVRFARGTARTSPWCVVEHREIDWASRSSC